MYVIELTIEIISDFDVQILHNLNDFVITFGSDFIFDIQNHESMQFCPYLSIQN